MKLQIQWLTLKKITSLYNKLFCNINFIFKLKAKIWFYYD